MLAQLLSRAVLFLQLRVCKHMKPGTLGNETIAPHGGHCQPKPCVIQVFAHLVGQGTRTLRVLRALVWGSALELVASQCIRCVLLANCVIQALCIVYMRYMT